MLPAFDSICQHLSGPESQSDDTGERRHIQQAAEASQTASKKRNVKGKSQKGGTPWIFRC